MDLSALLRGVSLTRILLTPLLLGVGWLCLKYGTALWTKLRQVAYMRRHLPGPPAHWLFGNVMDKPGPMTPGFEWYRNMAKTYRKNFIFWMFWRPQVFLNHPDVIRKVLTGKIGTKKGAIYQLFVDWLGGSLAIIEGPMWKRHRNLITPAFFFNALKQYAIKMNRVVDTTISKFASHAEQAKPLPLYATSSGLSCDVILHCAFSYESHCQVVESPYARAMDTLTEIVVKRFFLPHLQWEWVFRLSSYYKPWVDCIRVLHELQNHIISERRKKHAETKEDLVVEVESKDFLDMLLLARDSEGSLSDKEIRDEVNAFIFAGTDTTASSLTWLFYFLAKHPKDQSKVQAEVDELLEGRSTDEISCNDLQHLPYLSKCIKESLRMIVFISPNRVLTEPMVIEGVEVPAGTEVSIFPYQLHHNPDVWGEDHMEFRPDRFDVASASGNTPASDPAVGATRDAFAFLPFSAGERNCIGQQFAMQGMKIAAARLLARFNLSVFSDSIPVFHVVSRPQDEIMLEIKARDKNTASK